MRPLLLHKSCQTKAIIDFSDLTIRIRVSHIVTRAPAIYPSRGHMNCMLLLRPDIACACIVRRPDSTDVPTIYWRVNSSSLDGVLLLDFITQGPSYEPFIHIALLRLKSRKVVFP